MQQETQRAAQKPQSQFEQGHRVAIQHLEKPGRQQELADPKPTNTQLPTEDNGYQTYKAAGKLAGKRAIITGGDSGIGRATAILYAMEGASSLITYLPEEESDGRETVRRVEEYGQKCYTIALDLRERSNCKKVNMIEDIKDLTEDQWEETFATNIDSVFYLSKYTLPHLKNGSSIINCASINAYIGRPDLLDYTSTKGALISFTRGLSNQQIKNGIRVNAVCPGPVWTPLIPATMNTSAQEQFTSPMGRPGQPSEIATCFVFLASQDSSLISGQSLHPNGGIVVNG
ncbi:hypothetical protein N7509_001742 [Penicillium cosmopolitanum]|uniref:NAD(P)-binding protein n=1 Tax=Penicillium cosmopolitanum TaxID=1131564 RepID=A0A9W9W7Q5_9EURO|nr:uncharacterized protein N7509_001742 [Penicillium cosmopolitanum]KAJ5407859.1 hypothetical protein N7509_001742 [Penicillium cosmopolitanum]